MMRKIIRKRTCYIHRAPVLGLIKILRIADDLAKGITVSIDFRSTGCCYILQTTWRTKSLSVSYDDLVSEFICQNVRIRKMVGVFVSNENLCFKWLERKKITTV